MRFTLAALSTVLLFGAVYASPVSGGDDDDKPDSSEDGKVINIEHLE